jgi:hypothetical protein
MVQKPVDGTLQPIENSPPGIQTMPFGALFGTGISLGIVGAKVDPPVVDAPSSAAAAGESDDLLKTNNMNVPNKTGAVLWTFIKGIS